MKRRRFVQRSSLALAGAGLVTCKQSERADERVIVKAITQGPNQHWFGYYDKFQIDPTGRYALGMEVDLFFRSPTPSDTVRIGIIDLENDNEWTEIGTSTSWGWQQGCMLQWIPGSASEVIWNDHGQDGFVSHIYNIETGQKRTIPAPIYTLSNRGSFGLSVNFARLQFFRPGYGYPEVTPTGEWAKAPATDGIFKIDLVTGSSELVIAYDDIASIPRESGAVTDNFHWFNHLLLSPDDRRFIFLNRSRPVAGYDEMTQYLKDHPEANRSKFSRHYTTRAFTAGVDGTGIYPLVDSGMFSHFIWKGNEEICAWAVPNDQDQPAFYDFRDQSTAYQQVGKGIMTLNGHNTYVPNTNNEWILNDTYPQGQERLQELYLYHIPTQRKFTLGKFYEPKKFRGEWRCDLHPRCDQRGHRVFFDSTHEGGLRQMYSVDIREIIERYS